MTPLERKSLDSLFKVHTLYFEQQDILGVLSFFDEKIVVVDTEGQSYKGKELLSRLLKQRKGFFFDQFLILDSSYVAEEWRESCCLVYGNLLLKGKDEYIDPKGQFTLVVTAVCHVLSDEVKIKFYHISTPSTLNENTVIGSKMPAFNHEVQNLHLQRILDKQTVTLQEKIMDLDMLTNNIPGGVICCTVSPDLELLQYSEGFLKLFGYSRDEMKSLFQNKFIYLIHPEDYLSNEEIIRQQMLKGNTKEIEYRVYCKDGGMIWVQDRGQRLEAPDGSMLYYCILIDITEEKKAREALRLSLERHEIILNQATDIIFEWDMREDTLSFSSNWQKKFGYEPIQSHIRKAMLTEGKIYPDDIGKLKIVMDALDRGEQYSEAEFRIQREASHYIWCKIRATLQKDDDGRPTKAVGVILDINEEKLQKDILRQKAETDGLTGLYNKATAETLFQKGIEESLASDNSCTMIIIDIDNFKQVNDSLGHLGGDVLLTEVAEILQNMFRKADILGRIGGDEFAVLMQGMSNKKMIESKAKEILTEIELLMKDHAEGAVISCSIGIAIAPEDGMDFFTLYKNADKALYYAKTQGKNTHIFYENDSSFTMKDWNHREDFTIGNEIESETRAGSPANDLIGYIFHMLYQAQDLEKAIPMVLEIVGRQVEASRMYIFRDSEDGTYCSNQYEWCNKDVVSRKADLQQIFYSEIGDYYENFDSDGIFYCKDISKLPPTQIAFLEFQGIKSTLQCTMKENGKKKGFVGFDECENNRFWTQDQINILQIIAEILSVFLLKKENA